MSDRTQESRADRQPVRATADGPAGTDPAPAAGPPYADCVQCGDPTEYPVSQPGVVLCPVCEWQQAERDICSC